MAVQIEKETDKKSMKIFQFLAVLVCCAGQPLVGPTGITGFQGSRPDSAAIGAFGPTGQGATGVTGPTGISQGLPQRGSPAEMKTMI